MTTPTVNAKNRRSTWDRFRTLAGSFRRRYAPRKPRETGGGRTLGPIERAFLAALPVGPGAERLGVQLQLPLSSGYVLCGVCCATSFASCRFPASRWGAQKFLICELTNDSKRGTGMHWD